MRLYSSKLLLEWEVLSPSFSRAGDLVVSCRCNQRSEITSCWAPAISHITRLSISKLSDASFYSFLEVHHFALLNVLLAICLKNLPLIFLQLFEQVPHYIVGYAPSISLLWMVLFSHHSCLQLFEWTTL